MKVLVLGATGMLGSTALRLLASTPGLDVRGTARSSTAGQVLGPLAASLVDCDVDISNDDSLASAFDEARPEVVVNCVGVVKQLAAAGDPLVAIPVNALLPHRLAKLCATVGARIIHVSTDCVFDGRRGQYTEDDRPDANDLYGRSKSLGEIGGPHAITLRTSMIGPELSSHNGLLEWFLAQTGPVKGFRRAIFSGPTTLELCKIIRDHVLPRPDLGGLFHVGAAPISKFDLLTIIAEVYGRTTPIEPDDSLAINRSLDSTRFRTATGYVPPSWKNLITEMKQGAPA